jgi:putative heme-binding domain-containing protein
LLGDERFVVRERAIAELARRGSSSIAALREALKSGSADARRNAVWALTRIDAAEARAAVREALVDAELSNTLAALHSVGLWRDREAVDPLLDLLKSSAPAVRREAATAIGRCGNEKCVEPLLAQLVGTSDRFIEQALIFAVIEIDSADATRAGLRNKDPKIQRGALIALEQMPSAAIQESDVSPLLKSDDLALQKSALWILGRHSGWTQGLVEFLSKWLDKPELSKEQRELVLDALGGGKGNREVQQLIADKLESASVAVDTKLLLLEVMASGRDRRYPKTWDAPLRTSLRSANVSIARQAIATAAQLARSRFADRFDEVALDENRPITVRVEAAAAAAAGNEAPSDRVLAFLLEQCAAEETEVVSRLTIARALSNAHLTRDQLEQMIRILPMAGPLELPMLLKAYEECPEPVAGKELFAALIKSPGLHTLSATRVRQMVERYPKSTQGEAAELLSRFGSETESQAARMKELEYALSGGDAERGRGLFFGKAACSQCHKVDQVGSGDGPDLSQIGAIRTRRDLIEAIVFPSATFARGYEPVTVFVSGRSVSGVLRKETTKHTYILTADRSETAVPREEIEEIIPSRLSIMPQGLDRNLTPAEFRDLIAFLSALPSQAARAR